MHAHMTGVHKPTLLMLTMYLSSVFLMFTTHFTGLVMLKASFMLHESHSSFSAMQTSARKLFMKHDGVENPACRQDISCNPSVYMLQQQAMVHC